MGENEAVLRGKEEAEMGEKVEMVPSRLWPKTKT